LDGAVATEGGAFVSSENGDFVPSEAIIAMTVFTALISIGPWVVRSPLRFRYASLALCASADGSELEGEDEAAKRLRRKSLEALPSGSGASVRVVVGSVPLASACAVCAVGCSA
jgi:hypothetical protein